MTESVATIEEALGAAIAGIAPLDEAARSRAQARMDNLTKPPGSLGMLEEMALRVATIQRSERPSLDSRAVVVMAGDHGVTAEGVSPYPSEVTAQMVANFVYGGAAVNQLAKWCQAQVTIVDMGVASDLSHLAGVVDRKIRAGTANMATGPAMTREEALASIMAGIEIADELARSGARIVATGEMGIGNTTAATALAAAFTGVAPEKLAGPGTGLDPQGVARKAAAVRRALEANPVDREDPIGVLAAFGGLEIAGLAGVVIGCARASICVVCDGFISGAAALAAVRIAPACADYLFPSHRSAEPGHAAVLEALSMRPVLELDMRLGEGTGAVIAMGVMDAACRALSGMATFEEAGVTDRE